MRELYPPILPSYIPAFDYSEANAGSVKIYFQLSHYNSISQIAQAQVIVRFQSNNSSALSDEFYNEIFTTSVNMIDDSLGIDYPYYIEVPGRYIKNGFESGYIYKVQIRLSTVATLDVSPSVVFINSNLDNFSEWSTVCILKSITKPTGGIRDFMSEYDDDNVDETILTYPAGDAIFTGIYKLAENSDETPYSWRSKLYIKGNEDIFELLKDSGEVIFNVYDYLGSSSDNVVPFNCDFKTQLEEDKQYKIILDITSKNGYVINKEYVFDVVQNVNIDFYPIVKLVIDEEDAYAKLTVVDNNVNSLILTIRRSSSKVDFKVWEDIANFTLKNESTNIILSDYAIESGVIYQYAVQVRDNNHRRGKLIKSNKGVGEFEHSYLLGYNHCLNGTVKQLRLAYNVNISSFATTILETKIDTIGSKYPFIARNGDTKYKTFSISGLISYHMDETEKFTSREKTYGNNSKEYLDNFNDDRRYIKESLMRCDIDDEELNPRALYDEMYDYTYERDFREQVMEFLYDNKPKLFKSATEGNILVKLMDINFTPKQELGRLVYDFSATAYEIDEPTLENLNKYKIQIIDPYSIDVTYSNIYVGQLSSFDYNFNAGIDINAAIRRKYHIGENWNGIHYLSAVIRHLKITFESPPYLIYKGEGTIRPAEENEEVPSDKAVMGWLITYGTYPILITYPNNIYEFKDNDLYIQYGTIIAFPKEVEATVDYAISIVQEPGAASVVVARLEFQRRMGQLFGLFKPKVDFINTIQFKYFYDFEEWYQQVNAIKSVEIEAEPGTVFYIKETQDEDVKRFVINFTGILYLEPDSTENRISRGYFYGINIDKDKIIKDYGIVTNLPTAPLQFSKCTYNNKIYIYYKKSWYEATYILSEQSYDLCCPVDAIVNYYIQTVKGIYG